MNKWLKEVTNLNMTELWNTYAVKWICLQMIMVANNVPGNALPILDPLTPTLSLRERELTGQQW